jgi:predicted CoA-binding protein
VDVNPLIVSEGRPVAVDALVVLGEPAPVRVPAPRPDVLERFRPLFHPRGVIVAGASSHPGKFGFAACHNLLRFGFRGEVFPVNREGAEILGRPSLRDVSEVPAGKADLVLVCTPPAANVGLLRACAARGVRAAFVASGGYGESGEEGKRAERELVAAANEIGILWPGRTGRASSRRPSRCAPRSSRRTRRRDASRSPARAGTSCPRSATTPCSPESA